MRMSGRADPGKDISERTTHVRHRLMTRVEDVSRQAQPTYEQQRRLADLAVRTTHEDIANLPGWLASKVRIQKKRSDLASVHCTRAPSR